MSDAWSKRRTAGWPRAGGPGAGHRGLDPGVGQGVRRTSPAPCWSTCWPAARSTARSSRTAVRVEQALLDGATSGYRVIVTTGGTGLTPGDRTPEMTRKVIDREVPGITEAIRAAGVAARIPSAMLFRGLGMAGDVLIVNLPGSVGRGGRWHADYCPSSRTPLTRPEAEITRVGVIDPATPGRHGHECHMREAGTLRYSGVFIGCSMTF